MFEKAYKKSYKSKSLESSLSKDVGEMAPFPVLTDQQLKEVDLLCEGFERQLAAMNIPAPHSFSRVRDSIWTSAIESRLALLGKKFVEKFKDDASITSALDLWFRLSEILSPEDKTLFGYLGSMSTLDNWFDTVFFSIRQARGELGMEKGEKGMAEMSEESLMDMMGSGSPKYGLKR